MLTKLIVSSYQTLIEISLWLFLIFCLIVGWYMDSGVRGAIVGLVAGFVLAVMLFGAFLTLGDIRQSVRNIESSVGEALLQSQKGDANTISDCISEAARRMEAECAAHQRTVGTAPSSQVCFACGACRESGARFCHQCGQTFPS